MKFSIIIPVYNVESYLRACLDSLVSQTVNLNPSFRDKVCVEAICVDDGSTDRSGKILDEYREKVEKLGGISPERRESRSGRYAGCGLRMVVLHQKNAGVGAARNAALNVASGDWICSLDSDDVLKADALERIWDVLSANEGRKIDIVRFGFTCFSAEGAPDWSRNYDGFSASRASGTIVDFSSYVDTTCLNSLNWLHVYRKSLIADLRFKDFRNGEDVVFQTAAVVRSNTMIIIRDALYGYRCGRAGSACTTKLNERMTLRRVHDDIWSSCDSLEILARCGKSHDQSRIHWLAVVMTEGSAYNISRIDKKDRAEAWREWYDAVVRCRCLSFHILSSWARFVIRLNASVRIPIVARITCALPYFLKQHGVHR